MNLRRHDATQLESSEITRTLEPPASASPREEAADLRSRASAVRAAIAAEELTLEQRRAAAADEADALETRAREIEAQQDRIDRAAAMQREADELDAAAGEVDARAATLGAEIVDALTRSARLEHQLANDLSARRLALHGRLEDATATGDTESLVEIETELASLPAVEQRLRKEADAAAARASELNSEAARLESIADYRRRHAALVRRQANADPFAAVNDPEQLSDDALASAGGRRVIEFGLARDSALGTLRQLADPHAQNRETLSARFAQECAAAVQRRRLDSWGSALDEIEALVAAVDAAASRLAAPERLEHLNRALDWPNAHDPGRVNLHAFIDARKRLDKALAEHAARTGREALYHDEWPLRAQLPACAQLATSPDFEALGQIEEAVTAARSELAEERQALAAASGDGLL